MKVLMVVLVILAVIAVVGWFAYNRASEGIAIELTQQQIQERIDPKFPVEKNYIITSIKLSDPEVILKEGSDRIRFALTLTALVPTQPTTTGSAILSGKVAYNPEQAEFYLQDFEVEEVQAEGLDEKYVDQARTLLSLVGKEVLNRYPIYTLQPVDRTQALAKMALRSVEVANGRLRIVLGLPLGEAVQDPQASTLRQPGIALATYP